MIPIAVKKYPSGSDEKNAINVCMNSLNQDPVGSFQSWF
jgi:hypothetical protein